MWELEDGIATSAKGRLAMTNTNTKDVGINEGGRWSLVFGEKRCGCKWKWSSVDSVWYLVKRCGGKGRRFIVNSFWILVKNTHEKKNNVGCRG